MRLEFVGAARTVTGSCFLLEVNRHRYLIDCGMFQGSKRIRLMNRNDFPFVPADIDGVLLTHAHIDHSGLLPKLVKDGFKGKIYATKATCDLATIMLPDAAHIQEFEAEINVRKGQRSGEEPTPALYTMQDAEDALKLFFSVPYEKRVPLTGGLEVIYHDAGHIMGSAILEVFVTENGTTEKIVFSGDLGQPNQPILKDPTILEGADYLVIESTYGDRLHQDYDKETALAEVINDTMDRGGNLIIPAFAVGRTQALLYYFFKLWKAGRIEDVPVVIDSPLAIAATRIFAQNMQEFDEETLKLLDNKIPQIPAMPHLKIAETAEESKALNSSESSAIIMSASGMAEAGRILHHLKHNLWRPESTILFVGYQAEGSLGRRLVEGVKRVRILGEEIAVRAKVEVLDGFSAHADYHQMVEWVGHLENPRPAKIFLVHGESPAQGALKEHLMTELGYEEDAIYIPFQGDVAFLEGRRADIKLSTIPQVSVEAEMEEFLETIDSTYRQQRRKLLQLVIKRPELMEPVIKTISKGWNYMQKLFANYNL